MTVPVYVVVGVAVAFAVGTCVFVAMTLGYIRMATENTRDEVRGLRAELTGYREGRR